MLENEIENLTSLIYCCIRLDSLNPFTQQKEIEDMWKQINVLRHALAFPTANKKSKDN